ncbi:hypothetical protein F3Y22_tig00110556pilonHSYRG00055 [Hibiscus syriacus]|uniref:Senescence regulator S40 n=1 Tax=Hibiscus syriacus TaxID=106335 RepID=A0A6A3A7V8_HIBSY|nr:uncharacterized protein LOC120131467 [Hibiscus syriacus]KAE8700464.1 hypothetical protein F3Y22_tig00110556pilonHSYRG00055 [Hibiscus syriacus]
MAKGRRLTTSRSERFLGSYSHGHGQGQGDTAVDDVELGDEDVWSMVDNVADRGDDWSVDNYRHQWSPRAEAESNGNGNFDVRGSSRRRIPRGDRHVGGLSLAFEDSSSTKPRIVNQIRSQDGMAAANSPRGHHMGTSTPVVVPDWSTIYRVNSVEWVHDSDDGLDDGDSEMVPPHEYLAREYARSKKSGGASVFEGVGRTLKGRDMSRVRDAVWSQTGFDG